ncbi:carboxypeptidase-like regulatory domain-containing protein [Tenacibaculum xiamenense]|uniref:carboxypeptidase-like regulatory domain-containing protein n=1 Tax=Tenacibaculum xiamenense TaxID=1261553 RepID=UPI0038950871
MKIRTFLFLAFLYSSTLLCQITIRGKVFLKNNEALQGASVYLNNTSIGTITNNKGEFELKVKNGYYDLIISFLGFEKRLVKIKNESQENLKIQLTPSNNVLDEVIVKKTVYDDEWKYNLSRFKRAFFGKTNFAKECIIINEKDIFFNFNTKTNTLSAYSKKPIRIKNKALGYLITYELIDFSITSDQLVFSGYSQFKNLKKKLKKKWLANRATAFHGSRMHFFRSLLNKTLKQEGFVVNQFKRIKNPERPSQEKIKQARELLKLAGRIDISKKITTPKTAIDSAIVTLQKMRLPKFRDYLYKRNVPYSEMVTIKDNEVKLDFENFLSITYLKEAEEPAYLVGMFGKTKKSSGVQSSSIVLLDGNVTMFPSGVVDNPTSVFNEGYWGFEAFAHTLPLDYTPPSN